MSRKLLSLVHRLSVSATGRSATRVHHQPRLIEMPFITGFHSTANRVTDLRSPCPLALSKVTGTCFLSCVWVPRSRESGSESVWTICEISPPSKITEPQCTQCSRVPTIHKTLTQFRHIMGNIINGRPASRYSSAATEIIRTGRGVGGISGRYEVCIHSI